MPPNLRPPVKSLPYNLLSKRLHMSPLASDTSASPLVFEMGQEGRATPYVESGKPLDAFLPKNLLRDELPLPDNTELDVVRHFTRLSHRTFGIDLGFYPLGSCTMKYNPRSTMQWPICRVFAICIRL